MTTNQTSSGEEAVIVEDTGAALSDGGTRAAAQPRAGDRVIDSRTLFGPAREIRINHNGESYSLRMTRLGKLILTK